MKIGPVLSVLGLGTVLIGTGAQAKEWKSIRIGLDATYAPFESVNEKGEIVGFDVDYAKALCTKMKVTCTFQNQDWDGIIPSLLASKFDVIFSSMKETPERAEKVLFSDVYYATPPVMMGSAANKSDDVSPEGLKGKMIGAQSSTAYANYLEKYYKDSEIKLYPGQDEANLDLANGRIDYVVGDILVSQIFIEKSGNGCCRIIKEIKREPDIFGVGAGAAFRPKDKDLVAMFNKAIAEADADGTFKKIEATYFKIDIRGK